MKNRLAALLTVVLLANILFGCGKTEEVMAEETTVPMETTVETLPPVPEDGDPEDVTCKGTYTGQPDMDKVVAEAGGGTLTLGELQAWYWAAAASYRAAQTGEGPDFAVPLDRQSCGIDSSVNSWQQYFLKQALNNWHTAQALYALGQEQGLPVEEAFAPHEQWRAENMVDIPATKYLYREETSFQPNTMHQAYLDSIPQLLEEMAQEQGYENGETWAQEVFGTTADDLGAMAELYNQGYFYHTNLSYFQEATEEELEDWFTRNEAEYANRGITRDSGYYVDFRQILLVPEESENYPELTVTVGEDGTVTCDEALWDLCQAQADALVQEWNRGGRPRSEGTFSNLAANHSMDAGTAADGGAYRQVEQGQMIGPIDDWCFDEARKPKDQTVIRSEYGIHILYFVGTTEIWQAEAEEDLLADKQRQTIYAAREQYPMTVSYGDIVLNEAQGGVELEQFLYQDVAHERFPEVPLYLQQDYSRTRYGEYLLRTNGCGITSFAMLASYMTDDELTPPEMCARYGMYSTEKGTDVTLMMYEPAALGFYVRFAKNTDESLQALKDGHIVISIQTPGYWTRGGHYIVLEKLNEDGTVQVRDSNIFNYGRIESHKEDKHTWESITKANKTMWIVEKKLTRVPICSRCGDGQSDFLNTDYLCHKCRPALLRRDTYLSVFE